MSRGNRWHLELCIDRTEIARLYNSGLSTRQVASQMGFGFSYIGRICKELGLSRTKSDAAILACPSKSTHWRSLRAHARKTVERSLGVKLNPDQVVHHIDGDPKNNALSNLKVMSNLEHGKLHHPPQFTDEAGNSLPRHKRPHRVAYMRIYLAAYRKDRL